MAQLWAIMRSDIRYNPKTKALAARLGLSIPTVCGHLGLFWAWAVNLSIMDESGIVNDLTPGALERAAMWEGEKGTFFAAMRECGFLDGEPDSETDPLRVHEWGEYYKPLFRFQP